MITKNMTSEELLSFWNNLSNDKKNKEIEFLVKANLDSFYKDTITLYPNKMKEAGFFNDLSNIGEFEMNLDLFTTPVHKIINNINKITSNKPLVVILNTGSYSPIHLGHVQMMEQAKTALSIDHEVVGGYLSPSHDSYVSTKYNGTANIHSEDRISFAEHVVSESDWLMVDTWEARYNSFPINFTDVIRRLEQYLKLHTQKEIKIAYVFGSDNAEFSLAFLKNGISVCFERYDYETNFQNMKNNPYMSSKRNYFVSSNAPNISSTNIRNGDISFLPESIKDKFLNFSQHVLNNKYLIRDDSNYSTEFIKDPNKEKALDIFKAGLSSAIKEAFNNNMEVIQINAKEQNTFLNDSFRNQNILNIDLWTNTPTQQTLQVSRLFELADSQVFSNHLINRPGTKTLKEQIKDIPSGEYTLVDDDIASGRTVKMIISKLPEEVKINQLIALSKLSFEKHFNFSIPYEFHDIIDIRDFLIGSFHGGLVVNMPDNSIGRVPYVWPYVSLNHRAKIPANAQQAFNLSIWNINLEFFKSLRYTLTIADMDESFKIFAKYLGFKQCMTMVEFCIFHIHKFNKLIY